MARKTWAAGDKVLADDINENFNLSINFGGDGSDGALNVTTGTTNIDVAGANIVVKQYTTINIANGATLSISNPASTGTILIIKVQVTTTIAGKIDLKGKGASQSTNPFTRQFFDNVSTTGGTAFSLANLYDLNLIYFLKRYNIFCGAGGTGTTSGASYSIGGSGGGGLYMEVNGDVDFAATGIIDVSGTNAGVVYLGPGQTSCGGGGGGAVGSALITYNGNLTNSGTATQAGGNGAAGDYSYIGGDIAGGSGAGSYGAGGTAASGGAGGDGSDGSGGGGGGLNYPDGEKRAGGTGATTTKAIKFIANTLY